MFKRSQHYGNGLHVYCRLKDFGLPDWLAFRMAQAWEWVSRPLIYRR